MANQPHQSLYRQYRPQRFAEVRGQEHVTRALRNAVRTDRVGHAYLFSGPRGTGKTSTARILAKALNCTALADGEPCGTCESCRAVQAGTSLDVLELDAASNNGVDAMRDLVARASLGSPGRWKVYIVDEVHMLSTPASNALLKTLEEPPGHVVFVLATTDPQKVLPTIRSRTQHFEFHLLGADVLGELLRDVNLAAELGVEDRVLDQVVRRGAGSARDALSVLDQVVAGGPGDEEAEAASAVIEALAEREVGPALAAVAAACQLGRDPRRIAVEVVERLRQGFLAVMAPSLAGVPAEDLPGLEDQARRLGTPALVRAMEVLGEALVAMRDALDTRVTLEVALVRLCATEADTSVAALLERVDRLERRLAATGPGSGPPPAPVAPAAQVVPVAGPATDPAAAGVPAGASGALGTRPALGALRRRAGAPSASAATVAGQRAPAAGAEVPGPGPTVSAPADPGPTAAAPPGRANAPAAAADRPAAAARSAGGGPADVPKPGPQAVPNRDELTKAWGDSVLATVPQSARSVFRTGRWLAVEEGTAVFAVPNRFALERAEATRRQVEETLAEHFGARVGIRLVIDEEGTPAVPSLPPDGPGVEVASDDESLTSVDVAALEVAQAAPSSVEDRLRQAFPGAEEVAT